MNSHHRINRKSYRIATWSILLLIAIPTIIIIINSTVSNVWANKASNGRCEKAKGREDHLLRQPMNALSNLTWLIPALYSALATYFDYKYLKNMKKMKRTISEVKGIWSKPHLSFFFSLSCLFSCIGSGVYHACSGCRIGGYLDITSIFIQFWSVFVLLLYQLLLLISATKITDEDENNADINTNNLKKNQWIYQMIVLFCGYGVSFLWKLLIPKIVPWQMAYFILIAGFTVIIIMTLKIIFNTRKNKIQNFTFPLIPLALLSLLIGIGSWFPEEIMKICVSNSATSFFQLHALWHSGIAMAAFFFYVFLRTINKPNFANNDQSTFKDLYEDTLFINVCTYYEPLMLINNNSSSNRKTFPKNVVVDVIDEMEKGKSSSRRAIEIVVIAKDKTNRNRLSTIAEDE